MKINDILNEFNKKIADRFAANRFNNVFVQKGEGEYAKVYSTKNSAMVLKVFYNDDAYIHFLKVVVANHANPCFPKVGKLFQLKSGEYEGLWMVKSETLLPLSEDEWYDNQGFIFSCAFVKGTRRHRWNYIFKGYSEYKVVMNGEQVVISDENAQQVADYFAKINPTLKHAWDIVITNEDEFNLDIHKGNFMKRSDGTWVIIDPYKSR